MEQQVIKYTGANKSKEIKCVEKQTGWDIVHYKDGSNDVFSVAVTKGYKRQRVIL